MRVKLFLILAVALSCNLICQTSIYPDTREVPNELSIETKVFEIPFEIKTPFKSDLTAAVGLDTPLEAFVRLQTSTNEKDVRALLFSPEKAKIYAERLLPDQIQSYQDGKSVKVVSVLTIHENGQTFAGVKFLITPPINSSTREEVYGMNVFQLVNGQFKYRMSYGKLNDIFYGYLHTIDTEWVKMIDPSNSEHLPFAKQFYEHSVFNAPLYSQWVRKWKQDRSLSDYFLNIYLNTGWTW